MNQAMPMWAFIAVYGDFSNPAYGFTVIQVDSVELASGATNQNVIPTNTWVAVKDTNSPTQYVVVQAKIEPDIGPASLPADFIYWSAGVAVTTNQLQRKVPKGVSAHTELVASCGSSSATGDVWVIWADLEIRMTGETWDTPGSAQFGGEYDGTEELGVKLYNYCVPRGSTNFISRAATGKVAPIGQLKPEGINAITTNGWTIEREMIRHDYKDGAVWQERWRAEWTNDSTMKWWPPFTKFTPDENDKIYDLDGPNIAKFQGGEGIVTDSCEKYDNFRQWVTWNTNQCSDYSLWHWFACWKYTNDPNTNLQITVTNLGTGNLDFPTNAPVYSPP